MNNPKFQIIRNHSISSKRILANDAYYKLRDYLNASVMICKDMDHVVKMVDGISGVVDSYKLVITRRVRKQKEAVNEL